MAFRVRGLSPDLFSRYFAMSDAELRAAGALRLVAQEPGMPCRVSMAHIAPGDEVVLVNYEHLPELTPYRSRHAIYVGRGSTQPYDAVDVVPEVIRTRLVSVRAFDAGHMIVDADVVDGADSAALFERLLANPSVSYLHVHNAKRGCYSGRVERA
ncbi:DUF1203 domain-containing protein [Usitatibacter palustris]|nr:DUF1203 domain-containing protein [Usitatibacter palustris]